LKLKILEANAGVKEECIRGKIIIRLQKL